MLMKKISESKSITLAKNFLFCEKAIWEWDKRMFFSQFVQVVSTIAMTYAGIMVPVEIVSAIENQDGGFTKAFIRIGVFLGVYFISNILKMDTAQYIYRNGGMLNIPQTQKIYKKIMEIPYEQLEEKDTHKAIGKAWNVLKNDYMIRNYVVAIPQFIIALAGSVWYGLVVLKNNFVLCIFNILICVLGFILLNYIKKEQEKYYDGIDVISRLITYVNKIAMDSSAGKDIRIFDLKRLIERKYDDALNGSNKIFKKLESMYVKEDLFNEALLVLFNISCYSFWGIKVMQNEMSVAGFVLMITITTQFSNYLNDFLNQAQNILRANISVDHLRSLLEIRKPDETNKIYLSKEELAKGFTIEFENVSYSYPDADEPVLMNINLTINSNEKVAIIGLNGAGKTTLIKLLCGLYSPTEGRILINNIDVRDIGNIEEIVAALFQDSDILPISTDSNIDGKYLRNNSSYIEKLGIQKAVKAAGFEKKYNSLREQGNTLLVKRVNQDASDLSGGEKQKLLFARALYQNAKILILDEPTAALDPIAERKLYNSFLKNMNNVTPIFISHRLSSTVFCDEIVLLSDGCIKEKGSHKELMDMNGLYAELFNLQGQYYKEEAV